MDKGSTEMKKNGREKKGGAKKRVVQQLKERHRPKCQRKNVFPKHPER